MFGSKHSAKLQAQVEVGACQIPDAGDYKRIDPLAVTTGAVTAGTALANGVTILNAGATATLTFLPGSATGKILRLMFTEASKGAMVTSIRGDNGKGQERVQGGGIDCEFLLADSELCELPKGICVDPVLGLVVSVYNPTQAAINLSPLCLLGVTVDRQCA